MRLYVRSVHANSQIIISCKPHKMDTSSVKNDILCISGFRGFFQIKWKNEPIPYQCQKNRQQSPNWDIMVACNSWLLTLVELTVNFSGVKLPPWTNAHSKHKTQYTFWLPNTFWVETLQLDSRMEFVWVKDFKTGRNIYQLQVRVLDIWSCIMCSM